MLKIRMQRVGRKHEPAFRLVLTDSKNSPKSGKFLEILGNYDARRGDEAKFDEARIKHWMGNGAQTSDTVHNMLVDKKIISGKKINKLPKKSPIKKESEATEEVAQTPKAETPETAPENSAAAEVEPAEAPKEEAAEEKA